VVARKVVVKLKDLINQEQFVELDACVWRMTTTTGDGKTS